MDVSSRADDVAEADSSGFSMAEKRQAKRLGWVLALVSTFFVFEFIGAVMAKSNVLKADALHLLMDVLALALSLLAMRLAVRRPTARLTYGLRRAEPVAAMINSLLVLGATVEIVRDGFEQLESDASPESGIMLVVSVLALVVNGVSAWLLHDVLAHGTGHGHHHHGHHHHHAGEEHAHGHHPDHESDGLGERREGQHLNVRSARLHLMGDVLGSLAALVAALVIRMGGPVAVDPIASFVVALILVLGALRLMREAGFMLLEAAPIHLPVSAVREIVLGHPGVDRIHDLHVWTLGAGHDAITVHVCTTSNDADLGSKIARHLREKLKTEYVTVQVERGAVSCGAPDDDAKA